MGDHGQDQKRMRQQAERAAFKGQPKDWVQLESRLQKYQGVYGGDGNDEIAFVALKYYRPDRQCISQWGVDELVALSGFFVMVRSMTWNQIYSTGGKALPKPGVAYTEHDKLDITHAQIGISEDQAIFELRVGQKARVHGFRVGAAFFLVRLDKDHELMS